MTLEHRAGGEVRLAGRTLTGTAMRYGDISPDYRERFLPGAFAPVPATLPINLQHDSSVVVAEAATLSDSPQALRVSATLPEGSAALALVRRGALRGYSIEFHAKAERREAGVRVVERAALSGLALCDRGAYPQAKAETRARMGRTLRSTIPAGRKVSCECAPGDCRYARFTREAMGKLAAMMAEAFDEAWQEAIDDVMARRQGDIIAVWGSFDSPLASVSRGTLRGRLVDGDLEVEIDLPDDENGRAVLAAMDSTGVVVRPYVRDVEGPVDGDTQNITDARLRAIIVSSTDANEGWPRPVVEATPADRMPEGRAAVPRRRSRVWLL